MNDGSDECLPNRPRSLRQDIYDLEDRDLTRGITKLLARPLATAPLTEWEHSFCDGAARSWARYGELSWKQRRSARQLLLRVLSIAIRHAQVREWLDEEKVDP